jgi:folate-binding protein YgfZ
MTSLSHAELSGYRAAREGAALTGVKPSGVIVLTGPDRVRFLHNLISNDVKSLRAGQSNWSAALALKGKVLAVLRCLSLESELWLTLDPARKDQILSHLKKYKIIDKIEFADRSAALALVSVYGPSGSKVLEAAGAGAIDLPLGAHAAASLAGVSVRIDRSDDVTGSPGHDLYLPEASAAQVGAALQAAGAAPLADAALEVLRIEAGWPLYGVDVTDDNFPGEVELDRAVSYTKGCFLGQETVARIHSRGHVNRLLRGLTLDGESLPSPGSQAFVADKEVGHVTSACRSPQFGSIALALLHRTAADPGTQLEIVAGEYRLPAKVHTLPFHQLA